MQPGILERRWGSRRRQISCARFSSVGITRVERRHLVIQMAVIHRLDHLIVDDVLEQFQIDHHAGHRIRFAVQRYFQDVVVTMAVAGGAFAVQIPVLLFGKVRVVASVGRGELGLARDKHQTLDATDDRKESRPRLYGRSRLR